MLVKIGPSGTKTSLYTCVTLMCEYTVCSAAQVIHLQLGQARAAPREVSGGHGGNRNCHVNIRLELAGQETVSSRKTV